MDEWRVLIGRRGKEEGEPIVDLAYMSHFGGGSSCTDRQWNIAGSRPAVYGGVALPD